MRRWAKLRTSCGLSRVLRLLTCDDVVLYTLKRKVGSPAITVVRERCAIARRGAGGVGVVARMAHRVGAPTATNPGATRACYDLTEPCP